jgi:cardiolipin synthase A/B
MSAGNQMISTSAYTRNNKVKLVRGGKPYFELLIQLISEAKESIHLQTYIYDEDETGLMVTNALKEAVKRKVEVYVMADGYASQVLSQGFVDDLRKSGIHFRFFEPLFKGKNFYFGRRLHHKLFVVDAKKAMVAGVNISNRYNDMPGKPAWLDFALYAEGEITRQLCVLCWKTWKGFKTGMALTPCEEKEITYNIPVNENSLVRMRRNDWVRRKNQISKTYIEMFTKARSHITILSSYFLPGRVIKRNILKAVKRGIKIKVIMAGLSDIKTAKLAERYMYDWLLRNNVEIYEYQENILHGKIAVCDSDWITIGSYNVNDLSAYASIELNLDVKNPAFAKETELMLEKLCAESCIKITSEYHHQTNNIIKQFSRWVSYKIFRIVLFLFTFYFKQRN